jgi:aspartyl-tRNA(Asn)/glutamyl-tRNA(Gln) amidotransferase subunit B
MLSLDQTISQKMGKIVFQGILETGKSAQIIVEEKGLVQITDDKRIDDIISKVLKNNWKQVEEYKAGRNKIFGFWLVRLGTIQRQGKSFNRK